MGNNLRRNRFDVSSGWMPARLALLLLVLFQPSCTYTALQYDGRVPYSAEPMDRYAGRSCTHYPLYVIPIGDSSAAEAAKNLQTGGPFPQPVTPANLPKLKVVELGVQRYFWILGWSSCAVVFAEP